MTEPQIGDQAPVTILAAGPLAPMVRERLAAHFTVESIVKADPALVTPALSDTVRGVAVVGGAGGDFFAALPKLELVSSFGVGYDAIDVPYAVARGIVVTHTPDVLNDDVADIAIGLLLNTLRELPKAEAFLRAGRWAAGEKYPLTRGTLRNRRVGIFGLGRIGQAIARRLVPFGVEIAYHNRRPVADVPWTWHETLVGLAEAVDTLICVAPGGDATRHAVNANILAALGSQGVLVNVGRGSTVDEAALTVALADGTIMAAGLDVFEQEPHVPQTLIELPNAVLLPHVGSASVHTRRLMGELVADNLVSWFREGMPLTPVPECAERMSR